MQDSGSVGCCEAVGDSDEQLDTLTPGPLFGLNPILQRTAVDEFGDQVLPALELAYIVHSQNVRMIQRRCRLRLALESAAGRRIGQILRKKFDGNRAIQLGIDCAVYNSHPAAADRLDQLVMQNCGSGEGCGAISPRTLCRRSWDLLRQHVEPGFIAKATLIAGFEHTLKVREEFGVLATRLNQKSCSLIGREIESLVE